jgi:hypothetical protein
VKYLLGLSIIAALLSANAAHGYVPDDRWSTTASGPTGFEGSPITLTWGFARDGVSIPGESGSNLIAMLDDIFDVTSGGSNLAQRPWFDLFEDSFNRWAALGGITFLYEPNDDGRQLESAAGVRNVRADIRIGGANIDGSGSTLAYTLLPNNGDIVIDTGEVTFFANTANNYRQFRNTLMHELGHAIGLLHVESSSSELLLEPFINSSFDGPQLDEIRGIHSLYGDALEKTNGGQGNNSAALATALGMIRSGDSLAIGADARGASQAIGATETDFVSITDSFDSDYYSFSVSSAATLDLVLTPLGGMFTQSAENGQQATFNANARNNLSINLFDRNGTTLLASVNNAGAGQTENLSGFNLPGAGQYYVRVGGANDLIQLYELELSVSTTVQLLSGDYNLDGSVDASDYVVWRNAVGQFGTGLAADGNGDGLVDIGDFTVWRSNFGSTGPGAVGAPLSNAAVPEPTNVAALLVTLVTMFFAAAFRNPAFRRQ